MKDRNLNNWEEFRPLVDEIRAKYGNNVLFRGQSNAKWTLQTTLERCRENSFSVDSYVHHAYLCVNEIESFTGKKWDIPSWSDIQYAIEEHSGQFDVHLPVYDYLVYLRHYGFPSPFLDWTESPFIAAYFAYCEKQNADRIAMYAYIERPAGEKSWRGGVPFITLMEPYVTTNTRHFSQKARYTIATQFDKKHKSHIFHQHEDAFAVTNTIQDVLIKITIPSKERQKALYELSDYNINAFTLFQTEDALVKSLAIKELELNDK